MPTGPLLPDHDEPERPPLVVPLWSTPTGASFNRHRGADRRLVVVPFPLAPAVDPVRGVVFRGLFSDGPSYTAGEMLAMAEFGEGGFRFAEEGETR